MDFDNLWRFRDFLNEKLSIQRNACGQDFISNESVFNCKQSHDKELRAYLGPLISEAAPKAVFTFACQIDMESSVRNNLTNFQLFAPGGMKSAPIWCEWNWFETRS